MTNGATAGGEKKLPGWTITTLVLASVGLLCLLAIAVRSFGGLVPALSYLRGDRLILDAHSKSFGTIDGGQRQTVTFKLTNMTDRPIRLLGAMSSCTCVAADQLPTTAIARGATYDIHFSYRAKQRGAEVAESVRVFTDHPIYERVDLIIKGRVRQIPTPTAVVRPGAYKLLWNAWNVRETESIFSERRSAFQTGPISVTISGDPTTPRQPVEIPLTSPEFSFAGG
jgi:Protein of unknown function (DUF1573)